MEHAAEFGGGSLATAKFVGLAAAAAIDIIPRLVKGANAAADTSTGAPSLDASTAGASVQASGRSIAVSALLAGGAVLAKYEQEHGIIQGWVADRFEDMQKELPEEKQRRALVRQWRGSLERDEKEAWGMGASGMGSGLRALAPPTYNPALELSLVQRAAGGPTVTRTVLIWLRQEAGWRPIYARLDPYSLGGLGVPIEIVNTLEVGSIPCADMVFSIAGREFVSSAHVLQPPSPALLRAQAQAAAQAEGRELTPAELESRAGELSDGWRRMIVIPLQTITALIGQGVSVTLG